MMTKVMNASLRHKLKLDMAAWQLAWQKPFSLPLLARLMLLEAGYQFVLWLRIIEFVRRIPIVGVACQTILQYVINIIFGCDINKRSYLGGGLFVAHPNGIVIGADVVIGERVSLGHQTTFGRVRSQDHTAPVVLDGADISAGAKVLGGIIIGRNAVIGANAVVIKDVPDYAIAVGIPARNILKKSGPT